MSNWITDNKPAAMVAGVGLLLFLGLSATGYIVNSKRSELDKKISIAAKEIKSANAAEITPSRSSNEELEKELNRYAKAVGNLETAYKPFLASSALAPTTPTAFQNELKTFRDSLISSCKKKNILITDTSSWLGFQVYSTQAPSVQAASTLGFELKPSTAWSTNWRNAACPNSSRYTAPSSPLKPRQTIRKNRTKPTRLHGLPCLWK